MSNQLATIGNFSVEELQTIKQTLAAGTSDTQFDLFIRTSTAAGLNPFLNHIYAIVYGGKMSIQISVEGILYLAKKVDGFAGIDTQLVHENDEFEAGMDQESKWVIERHKIKFPRGKVIGCYSIAYRDGFKPVTEFMDVEEVQHHLSGNNASNWKKYFNDFFKKTVAKRALKRQFGIDISEDEAPGQSSLDSAGSYNQRQRVDMGDITPDQPRKIVTGETEVIDPAEEMEKQWAKIKGQTDLLGWKDTSIKQFISDRFSKKAKDLSLQELVGLSKLLEFEISNLEKQQQQPQKPNGADSIFDAI
jgi:recombination protein RecT